MLLNCGAGEDSLESLGLQKIQPVRPKGNQTWISIGRTDAEAPIIWPPDAKSWLIGKDPDAGKNWRQKEKRVTEAEMVGWHHWFNGLELGQTQGDGEGQRNLACCCPRGHRVRCNLVTEQQPNPWSPPCLLCAGFSPKLWTALRWGLYFTDISRT